MLDPESGELERAGTRIRLQEQPLQVLLALLAAQGGLVTREQLTAKLWPKGVVDFETGLNTVIRKLRVALGDTADTPRFIETLPRRGYRFIATLDAPPEGPEAAVPAAPVVPAPPASTVSVPAAPTALPSQADSERTTPRRRLWTVGGAAAAIATAGLVVWLARNGYLTHRESAATARVVPAPSVDAPVPARTSIAVLPFEDLTGHSDDAYLADGLHEEILNALARLRALTVISRTSVMQFRGSPRNVHEIAQRLAVGSVLEGSVRRDGNTLRLTIQLIDARKDRHVFAANYDRELSKILDLQSTVAREVADALTATLTQYERGELERVGTNSGDAYDRYLRALALFQRTSLSDVAALAEPRRLLEEALRFDPDYTDALALLAQADIWAFQANRHREDAVKAEQALHRALAIDPQLPQGILARGLYTMYVAHDPDGAMADLEVAARVRPNSVRAHEALGFALRRRARWGEALEHLERARDLDPLNPAYAEAPIMTLIGLRRYPEALEQTHLIVQRLPNDAGYHFWHAQIESYLEHSVEPLRALLRDHGALFDAPTMKAIEATIAATEGRYQDAIAAAKQTIPFSTPLVDNEILGFWYWAAGDLPSAAQTFRIAERYGREKLKRDPEDTDSMGQLALVESMLGEHATALDTIDRARTLVPEARDAINGPAISFVRSVILVRAGRSTEGYAEAARLLHVPYGAPVPWIDGDHPEVVILKHDSHYDALINNPPRL
jgi:TolB-like protein/DNA-binding winged helix-turn-helix (wHTH) protein/Tfp pilus assembly protein PilF